MYSRPGHPRCANRYVRRAGSAFLPGIVASLLPAGTVHALQVVGGDVDNYKTHVGESTGDEFGNAVCGPGDLDGDGIPDYVVAAYRDSWHGNQSGKVTAFSGADHSTIWEVFGEHYSDNFGRALAAITDLDGDGIGEVAISAPNHTNGSHTFSGKVYVLSGDDGNEIWTYSSIYDYQSFGTALAAAGDVDGDGFEDVVAGMPFASESSSDSLIKEGRIVVLSGDPSLGNGIARFMAEVYGTKSTNHFGFSVAGVGDLNGDGYSDLVVGVPGSDPSMALANAGRLTLLSGRSLAGLGGGLYIQLINGDLLKGELGYDVSRAGDVNGDGTEDFIAGAPLASTAYGTGAGIAYLFSGATRAKLEWYYGQDDDDHFGKAVAAAGDVDHDGVPDVIVGAPDRDSDGTTDEGSAYVFSGRTGDLIFEKEGEGYTYKCGTSVDGLGDLNGDGTSEIISASPSADWDYTDDGLAQISTLRPFLSLSKLSASVTGDAVDLELDFHFLRAGSDFQVMISRAGEGPAAFDAGGVQVPLSPDAWTMATSNGLYPRWSRGFDGQLDADGDATALISTSTFHPIVGTYYFAAVCLEGGVIVESSILQVLEFL